MARMFLPVCKFPRAAGVPHHRWLRSFEAEADRVDPDNIVRQILELTPPEPVKERAMAGV